MRIDKMSLEQDAHVGLRDHSHKAQTLSNVAHHITDRLIKDPMEVTGKWKSELNAIPFVPPGIKTGINVALTGFGVGVGLGRDLRRHFE